MISHRIDMYRYIYTYNCIYIYIIYIQIFQSYVGTRIFTSMPTKVYIYIYIYTYFIRIKRCHGIRIMNIITCGRSR